MSSILLAVTAARYWTLNDGTQHPTGFFAEELIVPHQIFTAAGADLTVATPGGVRPVVDERSLNPSYRGADQSEMDAYRDYLAEHEPFLGAPLRLEDVDPADYDAVFIPGGHGPMEDLPDNAALGRILVSLLDTPGKVVGAVCHGTAGLLPARRDDGGWAFEGFRMTSLTNAEETLAGLASKAPWLLEDRLRAAGAKFDGGAPWSNHVVIDGVLVTGQNPMSAADTAQGMLDLLA